MTPFDDRALLVMLLTFYPRVSPTILARARAERPEYFAGGVLFGSKGDKLRLPDGREWDLILAAGDPTRSQWQVALIVPGEGDDDPWPLEPGPVDALDPFDDDQTAAPPTFEQLAAGAIESLGGSGAVLDAAASTLAEHAGAGERAAGAPELDDAGDALDRQARDAGAFTIADELDAIDALDVGAATVQADYDEVPDRPQLPPDPTPTKPPDSELPPPAPPPQ